MIQLCAPSSPQNGDEETLKENMTKTPPKDMPIDPYKIGLALFENVYYYLPLTGPRNGSYTLGQVILARKLQSSCTTRTKSVLTILRTASTWTRPTRH